MSDTSNESAVRAWSHRFFVASMVSIPISIVILYLGMMATGGGHGTYGLWYTGLGSAFVCWALTLASCITALRTWKQERLFVGWLIPLFVLFIALTLIGIWGAGG